MAYRFSDKPVKPEDMLPRFAVRNGATLHISLDCFYWTPDGTNPAFYYRDPHHEPVPWSEFYPEPWKPQPDFPDMRYLPSDFTEIDLPTEGYDVITVKFDDTTINDDLTCQASFNSEEANTVNITITANLPIFQDEPQETPFTVFIRGTSSGMQDALCRGILVILPGSPYSS